jgi:predicted O-methyltransferase YrrM
MSSTLPTLDEVMSITSTVSQNSILEPVECAAMYDTICQLPDGATIVEVGCDLGRSSSIILQLAKPKNFLTIHIDPWRWFPERAGAWLSTMNERCAYHPFILLRMTTEEAVSIIKALSPQGIDMAFIDGSHDQPLIVTDLTAVASRIKPGGFLTAHDYPSAGVAEEVDKFVASGWTKHNQAGGFGVWRRD